MNGNGNGKKVRAMKTWPDAGAMESVGVLAFGACRRSVADDVFGAGTASEILYSSFAIFSQPSLLSFPQLLR